MTIDLSLWSVFSALTPSASLNRLVARQEALAAASGSHRVTSAAAGDAWAEAVVAAYEATSGQPPICRRAAALEQFAARYPLSLADDDLLAGDQLFFHAPVQPALRERLSALGWATNQGHLVYGYSRLLKRGIGGFLAANEEQWATAAQEQQPTLEAYRRAMGAFHLLVARLAKLADDWAHPLAGDLAVIADSPPATFHQALQLLWLTQVFVHAENPASAISFGRADCYLWPFLERDLAAGAIDWQRAFDLLGAFFLKCGEGGESQNLVVGGTDGAGEDTTNPLTLLVLATMKALRTPQPSLCVRWHPDQPLIVLQAAAELAAVGTGQPGFINDLAAVPALERLGVSTNRARAYAIVGCYEATPPGDTYPNTVGGNLHLIEELQTYLAAASPADFEALFSGWLAHVQATFNRQCRGPWQAAWNHWRDHAPSPFGSLLMQDCLATATPLEAGGARHNFFGVNILGLGTVIDSLDAIRQLVYERRQLTLAELATAARDGFPDERLRQELLHLPGRYGTDTPATNDLAQRLSTALADMVLAARLEHGVRPYPGLFKFYGDIYQKEVGSPDGRRPGDLISYGVGPSAATETTATAILASAAHVAHDRCACGNPLALTLNPADVVGANGWQRLAALVTTYFNRGGFHLHINVTRAEDLAAAKAEPTSHGNLMVRVSGFSARFVKLDGTLQDALIERADSGR